MGEARGEMGTETNTDRVLLCRECKPSWAKDRQWERDRDSRFQEDIMFFLQTSALRKKPCPIWVCPGQCPSGPLLCPPGTEEPTAAQAAGGLGWQALCADVQSGQRARPISELPASSGLGEMCEACRIHSLKDHERRIQKRKIGGDVSSRF